MLGFPVGALFGYGSDFGGSTFRSLQTRRYTRVTDLNSVNQRPITNITSNARESMRVMSCITVLNLNHTVQRFKLMFKPVKEIVLDFVCNNCIALSQRTHLVYSLRDRIACRRECGHTQLGKYPRSFEAPRLSPPDFGNDCKMMEVSEELGITQSVISRLWQRFQNDGNVSRCYSTGRPRVTMPNEDQYIYLAVTAKRNRWSTASDLSRQLSSATGTIVSRQTVYRRLGHIGLYARRPVRWVPLTATHCRVRLTWSREHALWTPQQWSCVMFSDEYRFSLQSESHRTLIRRAPGTRYHQENTIERDTVTVVQDDSFGEE
ncbi:HTH_Tnp_Tc3_2 domain-containing protein [Trichonephila clavipes]|nr:HTH_Tnp_Tc3_2 domain-containing protein [Trichonephila clavipes]